MLCRHRTVPRALAWLGLVSYSVYLLHPALIEAYASVPFTRNENFVPMELLLVAAFVAVLLTCCGLTHRFIEAPMQRIGRRVGARLDARFGPDTRGTLVTPDEPVTPDSTVAADSAAGGAPPASLTADQAVSGTPRAAGAGPR
jgi:hypothetical protein